MSDIVSKEKRSQMMAGIKSKNTKPELQIREMLFSNGFRYRLHLKNIPGKPDLVLKKHNVVIFINGCFWHMHNCSLFKMPSTREEFWKNKLLYNKQNDVNNIKLLKQNNWRIIIIWECSLKGKYKLTPEQLFNKISKFIYGNQKTIQIRGKANKRNIK